MKLCPTCVHFRIEAGFGGSDVTAPEPSYLECGLFKWMINPERDTVAHARRSLQMAETCADYQLYTEAK